MRKNGMNLGHGGTVRKDPYSFTKKDIKEEKHLPIEAMNQMTDAVIDSVKEKNGIPAIEFDPVFIAPHNMRNGNMDIDIHQTPFQDIYYMYAEGLSNTLKNTGDLLYNQNPSIPEMEMNVLKSDMVDHISRFETDLMNMITSRYEFFVRSLYYSIANNMSSFIYYMFDGRRHMRFDPNEWVINQSKYRFSQFLPTLVDFTNFSYDSESRKIYLKQLKNMLETHTVGITIQSVFCDISQSITNSIYETSPFYGNDKKDTSKEFDISNENDIIFQMCIGQLNFLINHCTIPILLEVNSVYDVIERFVLALPGRHEKNLISSNDPRYFDNEF